MTASLETFLRKVKWFVITTNEGIIHNKRLTQLLILVSFLITFWLIRTLTNLQRLGIIPNQTGDLHIHHLVPGIILLLISGYSGLSFWNVKFIRVPMAICFGIGAALTIDEFALWLYLRDVYWERQGRDSLDAVIFVITLLSIIFIISEAHDHIIAKKVKRLVKNA